MSSAYAIALALMGVGVALALASIINLILVLRRIDDHTDERLLGDLPKVPEFIHGRRDDE